MMTDIFTRERRFVVRISARNRGPGVILGSAHDYRLRR
jgi:hypothetical protein